MSIGETFSRSWEITKKCFHVINSDKEILLFPLVSSISSIIFFVLMVVPFVMAWFMEAAGFDKLGNLAFYGVMFLFYLGISFIATFFNVGVVYCAQKRLSGGDPTFMEGIKVALSKIHLIFLWSIVSATVGVILRSLESNARDQKGILRFVLMAIVSALGMAWSIVTLFVVPALVIDNVGPIDAIKHSVSALKKTWGESLIRHYGLGLAQTLVVFAGLLPLGGIAILMLIMQQWVLFIAFACLAVIYLVVVSLVFSTANTVFNTALYMYAKSGTAPKLFGHDTLANAFGGQKHQHRGNI
jgi:hypothetical protein